MSITVSQYPVAYVPHKNPQIFTALSSNIGFNDFLYKVVCTDLITSDSLTYYPKQRPVNGKLVFPAHNFSKDFIRHFIPNNEYGFVVCEDAIRKIKVELREFYSSAEHIDSPPDTYEYIIWNAALRTLEWVDYDLTDFVYKSSTNNFKYLSAYNYSGFTPRYKLDQITYEDRSSFIYVLSSEVGDVEFFRINCYDSSGNLIQYSDIANPYQASSTYTDKYVCIDVGRKGLDNIAASVVTGSYPIIPSNCYYYEVVDMYTTGNPPPAEPYAERAVIQRLYLGCEPTFPVYTLHYKTRFGNFETLHFNKNSELRENAEKRYFRVNPNTLSSTEYKYTKFDEWEENLSSTGTENLVLNSDWLEDDLVAAHKEIVTSPLVYIDYGSTIGLVPCKVLDSGILENKEYNNKLFGITLNVEPTYKNNY